MATYFSILAWRIPWTEEPGGLPFMGSHRVGHVWSNLAAAAGNKWKINSICCSPGTVGGFSWRMHHLSSLHCSFSSPHTGSRQKDTCILMEDVSKVVSLVEFVFLVLHTPVFCPISFSSSPSLIPYFFSLLVHSLIVLLNKHMKYGLVMDTQLISKDTVTGQIRSLLLWLGKYTVIRHKIH